MLTQEKLKEYLHYDPLTGVFTWMVSLSKRIKPGQEAGSIHTTGEAKMRYIGIYIHRKRYHAHRLAFLYMEGFIPDHIDHEDTDGTNNRWSNLRKCSKEQNAWNRSIAKNNSTGVKGVSQDGNMFRARVMVSGKRHTLGTFTNMKDAVDCLQDFRKNNHKEFANNG